MYLWKCWRDTRSTFLVLLGATLAIGVFGVYVYFILGAGDAERVIVGAHGSTHTVQVGVEQLHVIAPIPAGAHADRYRRLTTRPDSSAVMWRAAAQSMMLSLVGIAPLAGFLLGSLGVGVEFEKRTADFLLTRPRSRRYFLWNSWGLGMVQMLALTLLVLIANWLAPFRFSPPRSLHTVVSISIIAMVIYSVTYLTTTLARSSRNGLALSLLVFTAYGGVCVWLRYWSDIQIPIIFELLASGGRRGADIGIVIGWLVVALVSMLAAQFAFERQEV